jgi:hypothetical protein
MLGTLFDSLGAVIGIQLAFAFGQQLLPQVPGLADLLPYRFAILTTAVAPSRSRPSPCGGSPGPSSRRPRLPASRPGKLFVLYA